jgi:hypothetical protein
VSARCRSTAPFAPPAVTHRGQVHHATVGRWGEGDGEAAGRR